MQQPSASEFMTLGNMRGVMELIESRMTETHWRAVQSHSGGNARQLVLQVMQEIDRDPDYASLGSVPAMNDAVVQASWGIIDELARDQAQAQAQVPDRKDRKDRKDQGPVLSDRPDMQQLMRNSLRPEPFVQENEVAARSDPDLERDIARARIVEQIVKEPWAPPARPPDVTLNMSIDGFDRDVKAYPTRFNFQYTCGNNVRNVTRITATSLLLPVSGGDVPMTLGVPYVVVSFDELSADYDDGASSTMRRSFCKFIVDRIAGFPGSRSFAVMLPSGGGDQSFSPPMPSLQKLTVRFTLPDGGLISLAQDTHTISGVYLNTDAAANWVVQTGETWITDFEAGDIVKISGVNTSSARVNEFLNRTQGHSVVAQGAFVQFLAQRSSIVIARPYMTDPVTRLIVPDVEAQNDLNTLTSPTISGSILNVSLQASLSLQLTCAPSVRHEVVM